LIIRTEQPADIDAIWRVNAEAFGRDEEANLVNALRDAGIPYLSLVAEDAGEIVGHILFTPMEWVGVESDVRLACLGPLAVATGRQRQGVGGRLMRAGLEACRAAGYDVVVLVGHPEYYPRFGFMPAYNCGLALEFDVPPAAFMLAELQEGALQGQRGTVRFHPAFGDAM
jgi:putative acetyltransferase